MNCDPCFSGRMPNGNISAEPYASKLTTALAENAKPIQNAIAF